MNSTDCNQSFITKEFLEFTIGKKVAAFSVDPGSSLGDNYMSILYSISADVIFQNEESSSIEKEHYMLKCYPSSPSRQVFLSRGNHFYNELSFYKIITKDLLKFQTDVVGLSKEDVIPLGIPHIFGGEAINYLKETELVDIPCSPLDNFILMEDLKSHGFKMADVTSGLYGDHLKLAFQEIANLHALSWAYRKRVCWDLNEKYPFLEKSLNPKKREMWLGILAENVSSAVKAIDSMKGPGNHLSQSLKNFLEKGKTIIEFFSTQDESLEEEVKNLLRIPPLEKHSVPVEPWRVICHGDAWSNNLLFKYDTDTSTEKPTQVKLIDFPLVKMGCPTLDLCCLVYTSSRAEVRRNHLHECLQAYYNRFMEICQTMKAEPPPGFSMESLQDKFHVSKLVGLLIAVISLPMNLMKNNGNDEEPHENIDSTEMEDMLHEACSTGVEHKLYAEWMAELIEEMFDEGVI